MVWALFVIAAALAPLVILWLWGACEALGAVISDAMQDAFDRWDR